MVPWVGLKCVTVVFFDRSHVLHVSSLTANAIKNWHKYIHQLNPVFIGCGLKKFMAMTSLILIFGVKEMRI